MRDGGVAARNVCSRDGAQRPVPMGARPVRTAAPPGLRAFAGEARFGSNVTSFVSARGMWGGSRGSRVAFASDEGAAGAIDVGWVLLPAGAVTLESASLATDGGAFNLTLVLAD